jgi:transcriptional regulator GlxA family with amidase domain
VIRKLCATLTCPPMRDCDTRAMNFRNSPPLIEQARQTSAFSRHSTGELIDMDVRVETAICKMRHLLGDRYLVRDVARSVNLSPRRLGQLFKIEIGVSPMQFVRNLRMARAQALLRSSFLTIKEVTFQSGFTDVSHFVRDFKQCYGVTPSEYRVRRRKHRRPIFKKV